MADTKIQPGLIEPDELSQFPSAANQLGRFGIDPDMARANPELLAPLNPQAAQASAPVAPGRTAGGGTDYGMLAANEPAAAIPSPTIAAPGKAGGASAAPTPTAAPDITAPVPPRTATDQGAAGLSMMRRNADAAMTAASAPPARNPEEDRLRAQQLKLAAPRLNDPVTGKMLSQVPEYDSRTGQTVFVNPKASVGQKIWRGVRGGLTGLALGGVRGAVVGALNPQDMPGGTAYGAPDSAFQKAEAVRGQELGDTNNALATATKNWKDQQDAAEARQGKADTAAKGFTTASIDAQKAATDALKERDTATNQAATQANSSPEAKLKLNQQEYDQRATRVASMPNLSPLNKTLYMLNGKIPDPQQPNEAEINAGQAARALVVFRAQHGGAGPQTLEDFNQIQAAARGALDRGKGKGAPTEAGFQGLLKQRTSDYNLWQKNYDAERKAAVTAADPVAIAAADAKYADRKNDLQTNWNQRLADYDQEGVLTHVGQGTAVAPPAATGAGAPVALPNVGDVRKGYSFQGGDPADQNSWKKVSK